MALKLYLYVLCNSFRWCLHSHSHVRFHLCFQFSCSLLSSCFGFLLFLFHSQFSLFFGLLACLPVCLFLLCSCLSCLRLCFFLLLLLFVVLLLCIRSVLVRFRIFCGFDLLRDFSFLLTCQLDTLFLLLLVEQIDKCVSA